MNKTVNINVTKSIVDANFDVPILLVDSIGKTFSGILSTFEDSLKSALNVDPNIFKSGVSVIPCSHHPSGRLIVSCTGSLSHDYDDGRRFYEGANDGVARATKMGLRRPLLVLGDFHTIPADCLWSKYPHKHRMSLLGALNALYTPLELREYAATEFGKQRDMKTSKADVLGIFTESEETNEMLSLITEVWAIEEGKRVSRDIGGSDPQRMAPRRIAEYLREEFADTRVSIEAVPVSKDEYPLAAAVNRGSQSSDVHNGCILKLEYYPEDKSFTRNVLLVGKGITYDTGGHDLKVGGNMATMHRDKCGAGVVAGLFKTVSILNPGHTRYIGRLACVRNCIGPDAYVSDEVITARSGVRVRVNNTDAEGRMVMADLLCEMAEEAARSVNPFLFTVATLTGHAMSTYGDAYGALMTNRPGRRMGLDLELQSGGELMADLFEVSRLRREDWRAHVVTDDFADLTNSLAVRNKPYRGHQSPAVFLMQASGMDKSLDAGEDHLVYTHLDIAGPEVKSCPGSPMAAGLAMLANNFVSELVDQCRCDLSSFVPPLTMEAPGGD